MAKKNEAPVAEKSADSTAVATMEDPQSQVPAVADDLQSLFSEDSGAGMENVSPNDMSIPFMSILQKGSPQVSRANAKYLKGAEQGMIMNTVTGELYSGEEGILFIPCGFRKSLVRWKSRDSGGGLVGHYPEGDAILKECAPNARIQMEHKASKDLLIETAYHFGLVLTTDGSFKEWAIISMASTQLKASRNWNTVMRNVMIVGKEGKKFNPATFSHVYRLTTIGQVKDTYDWFGWKIVTEGKVLDVPLYRMAREFSKLVAEGKVRISSPQHEVDESTDEAPNKDDVPF